MERVRARDADAFETLYDEYHRLVYGLALRVLSDQAAAEDVTQAVFLKIWGRPGVVPGRQFPADGSRASPVTARTTCCGAARCTARASSPSRFPPTTRWKTKRWRTSRPSGCAMRSRQFPTSSARADRDGLLRRRHARANLAPNRSAARNGQDWNSNRPAPAAQPCSTERSPYDVGARRAARQRRRLCARAASGRRKPRRSPPT